MPLPPFNPLDKRNLGKSVADALVREPFHPLPPVERFEAAGIYAIYYSGDFGPYKALTALSKVRQPEDAIPIYVGKAVPDGARKGGSLPDDAPGNALYDRLRKHSQSIRATSSLSVDDFRCRFLSVDSIWIPLGETLLIDRFSPLWNQCVEGFGNNDPGSGRHGGKRSPWDVLHPGRPWADKLQAGRSREAILAEIADYLSETYGTD